MRLVIIFSEGSPSLPGDHSLALQYLAGSNVLGHVLNQLVDFPTQKLVLLLERDEAAVTSYVAKRVPDTHVDIFARPPGVSPIQQLAQFLEVSASADPLLLVHGNKIVEADFSQLPQVMGEVVCYRRPSLDIEEELAAGIADPSWWAGICYLSSGELLKSAVRELDADATLADLPPALIAAGLPVSEREATLCLSTSSPEKLIQANARLLGLGYGSQDAIERSYAEDFTVLPPVFLHETAEIENAVVGPFANVEAGARISDSIIRNSLIGEDVIVENAVLDQSILGARVQVRGKRRALVVDDDRHIVLDSIA